MDDQMLADFRELDSDNPSSCDGFFGNKRYFIGNSIVRTSYSLERFNHYQSSLAMLQQADPGKYTQIHKGTPFYFLGWLAFDLRNYSAAISYLTAAMSEDERKSPGQPFDTWIQNPAGKNMLLNSSGSPAARVVNELRRLIEKCTSLFNQEGESTNLSIDNLLANFLRPMLKDKKYALIASFYVWILEYQENYQNLKLTVGVDSMEPIIIHLFKGGLIFETILKYYFTKNMDSGHKTGKSVKTLGNFMFSSEFTNAFPGVELSGKTKSLQEIIFNSSDHSLKVTMTNTARLRNTTGHKLPSDNPFDSPGNYKKLFEQELFALFYVICNKLISNAGG